MQSNVNKSLLLVGAGAVDSAIAAWRKTLSTTTSCLGLAGQKKPIKMIGF